MSEALTARETEVLREAVWHAVQRGDIPDDDRSILHSLYTRLDGETPVLLNPPFKDTTDELRYHLIRAERHAQSAYELLFKTNAPKRGFWFRAAVGRAQSILMSCYVREVNRK